MRKRKVTLLVALLVFSALGIGLYLRQKAPPSITRILPEADAIVYFNFAPLRAATHFDKDPVTPAPAYKQFIDATGIQPERDLDRAAFALTRMPDAYGPNGPVAFSEVFSGTFDTPRLTRYLATQATAQEIYAAHTVYAVPSEGRTLRVVLLDRETVAASNAPTPEQLHAIIDRARGSNLFASPSLLGARYDDVPALSTAWAIGHIALPFAEDGKISLAGLQLPVGADNTFIASLRFTTSLHLRIDQLTVSQADAEQTTQTLLNLLTLFRSLEHGRAEDAGLNQFFDSIAIEPHRDRATLTATLPTDVLKKLTAQHP